MMMMMITWWARVAGCSLPPPSDPSRLQSWTKLRKLDAFVPPNPSSPPCSLHVRGSRGWRRSFGSCSWHKDQVPRNLHCPWGGWRETRPEVLGGKFSENNISLSELAIKRTYSLNDFHFPFGIWALGFPAHPQTSCAGKQLADYRRLGGLIFNQLQVQRGAVYCSDREPPNYRLVQLLHRATKKTFKQTTTTGL